jgi:hypothetical protein
VRTNHFLSRNLAPDLNHLFSISSIWLKINVLNLYACQKFY